VEWRRLVGFFCYLFRLGVQCTTRGGRHWRQGEWRRFGRGWRWGDAGRRVGDRNWRGRWVGDGGWRGRWVGGRGWGFFKQHGDAEVVSFSRGVGRDEQRCGDSEVQAGRGDQWAGPGVAGFASCDEFVVRGGLSERLNWYVITFHIRRTFARDL
jgi:hypothetical protein